MIRMTLPVIGPELLHVINSSITSGVLPTAWKMASIIPLHTSGCKLEPNNYGPVSILPTVAKITECIICEQLVTYLVDHHILCSEQHGFRPGHSTESAMLDAIGHLVENIDSGLISFITTADTSKAFDSVKHTRLLEKLGWYGICSDWFEDWLAGRSQRVRGGLMTAPVTHGIIQGSLLGPISFLLFRYQWFAILHWRLQNSYVCRRHAIHSLLQYGRFARTSESCRNKLKSSERMVCR